ncbi:MAG TPA: hypothetical protein PL041_07735 [Melioribacteraceae bacterium]|nr:hypothetical protein [Melioribacteraceae bacterium]
MSTNYARARCENCDSCISLKVYEENDGICNKCQSRQYPPNCFDPRKDMQAWWITTYYMSYNKRPIDMAVKRVRYSKGCSAAE